MSVTRIILPMLLAASMALLTHSALAIPRICERDQFANQVNSMVHLAGVVDEDDRRTPEKYAEENDVNVDELRNKIAATGKLDCGGAISTANVVGANDLIVAANHSFIDFDTCEKYSEATECVFEYEKDGAKRTVRVSSLVAQGLQCPGKQKRNNDWAVMKLESAIDVEPYTVTPDADSKILDGAAAIAVGAESHDFFPKGKHIGNCTLKDKEVRGRVTRFTSNCDAGQGASGGAILSANLKNPTFLGITVSGSETSEQVEQAMRTRKPHRGKYDLANWRTTHVPLNGAFLASVLEGMSM